MHEENDTTLTAINKDGLNSQHPSHSLNLNSKTSCGFIFLSVAVMHYLLSGL